MARPVKALGTSGEVKAELQRRAHARAGEHRQYVRANIILLRLEGLSIKNVAERLGTTPGTVQTWSSRFQASGLAGLEDRKGRGRKPSLAPERVARVLTEATRPPMGQGRWSIRSMARHAGVSRSSVQRIWSRNDLKPHVVRTFKPCLSG